MMLTEQDMTGLSEYFANQEDVVLAFLFGSQARGDAHARSDVDLAVLLDAEEPVSVRRQAVLLSECMSILGRNDVDLVVLNRATPLLAHRVLRDRKDLFIRSQEEFAAFFVHTLQQYEDTKPLRDLQYRQVKQYLRERREQRGLSKQV